MKTQTTYNSGTRYNYDSNGNLFSENTSAISKSLENPALNVNVFGNGNVGWNSKTGLTFYNYNVNNQLTSVVKDGKTATYTYNPDGYRSSKTVDGITTNHIWNGTQIVAETNSDDTVKALYIYGAKRIYNEQNNVKSYYLYDAHGDTKHLTNSTGSITCDYTYDAFGNELDLSNDIVDTTTTITEPYNPFRYCGEYFDQETGFIYLRARYYSPEIGRFVSEDPIADGLNWYVYTNNNPVKFTDSTGLDSDLDEYVNTNYAGKITVTIAASRPVENSRIAVSLETGDVGHTFVRIDYGDGNVIYRGFYPSKSLSDREILLKATVMGSVADDAEHDWNAAVTYEITKEQADKMVAFIDDYKKKYNMVTNNCTTFSVQVLEAGGVTAPTSEHEWTLPDNTRQMVIDSFQSDQWYNGLIADSLISGLKGYSPADAVQDFKNAPKYVLNYESVMHTGINTVEDNSKKHK